LRRNPVLKTKNQFRIDSARVNSASSDVIRPWFQKLEVLAIKAIKPENRWNMDEAGIMEGQGENSLVVGSAGKRFIQKKQPGSRAWTSFIECISATGRALHPLVMFKGKSVQQQWFPMGLTPYQGWKFTATENGWTSDVTALEWLQKVFIP
jgi:DDE superfamily endonuclease